MMNQVNKDLVTIVIMIILYATTTKNIVIKYCERKERNKINRIIIKINMDNHQLQTEILNSMIYKIHCQIIQL